jgi:hypothetical protein
VDFLNAAEHCTVPSIQPTGRIPRRHGRKARSIATCCSKRRSGVGKVIQALVYLNGKYPQRKGIRAGAGPFPSSLPAHDPLPTLRARHEPIGSGVTEAACKTHVGQGRKRSRMPRRHAGGQTILALRALPQSKRFHHGWALLSATYRAKVGFRKTARLSYGDRPPESSIGELHPAHVVRR